MIINKVCDTVWIGVRHRMGRIRGFAWAESCGMTPETTTETASDSSTTKKRRWPLIGALGAVGVGALGFFTSCSSMSKATLQAELAALPKNVQMGAVERLPMTVDLGDGPEELELVYYKAGTPNPDSLPVVLIHGTPSTLYSWSEVIHGKSPEADDDRPEWQGLAETHEVYAIEVIGHGIAPGSAQPYSFEKCARYIGAALEALELDAVFMVGTSYGGEFVWRAALNEPERIQGIVLLDSSGIERREEDWLSEEEVMRDFWLADYGYLLNSKDRINAALEPHFENGAVPLNRVDEFHLVCENKENWKAMIDLVRDEQGKRAAELAELEARALLVWGADDLAYPADYYATRFDALIPDSEVYVLDGIGHYPHDDRTKEVLAEMRRFFTR